jgi:D-hexose-6-phosphate mutarotase
MTGIRALDPFQIDDQLQFREHNGNLIAGEIRTLHCTGEFFVQGAHITSYQLRDQEHPILFVSSQSQYAAGKPIRGGIPICFPWFSAHPSDPHLPAHGWARNQRWELISTKSIDKDVQIELRLINDPFELNFVARFGKNLKVALSVTNQSKELKSFEIALHTYFQVSNIANVLIDGDLRKCSYLDQLTSVEHPAGDQPITFEKETDRIYDGKATDIRLVDKGWNRTIHLTAEGSESTIVWNPWIAKSKRMVDFGDEEYLRMCCIETGNVRRRAVPIAPGETHTTSMKIHTV